MDLTLKTLQSEYAKTFETCTIRQEVETLVKEVADRLVALRSHYEAVEQATGIPWWFAGILHYREWNFQEPALFERQVIEVLMAKKYHQAKTRTLGAYLWGFDLWNGFRDGAGSASRWVWGGSNVLEQATEQLGAATLLVHLQNQNVVDIAPKKAIDLLVLTDTLFKIKPDQSFRLPESDKLLVAAGTRLQVLQDAPAESGHVKFRIPDGVLMGQQNRYEWYVFREHIQLEGTTPDNKPQDPPVEPETKIAQPDRGRPITVPKLGTVYLGEPILPNGHFSWAEATKNGSRIPVDEKVVNGILKIAEVMEEVRDFLGGRPITINSWYRDPASNRKVGGAKDSRHMYGDAVDFVVQGIAPPEVNRRLESWWSNRGGLASASSFTHIDARGYRARWRYGF
ncbi:D-Ala-D-Ala carboxypeptidase family metallohydrolase [Leptolyngbya sp. PCC 6406]|uniref:D-Ala-D-Ala carboxypeptidase family metallohydrolase n=1 Tax=Leptolyngbya sp. PCC 6406 TaxID=1173264 RepID=UPI0002ACBAEB|nr:D-Ala-D-Ala carboxypeptidase family metallohydrolase [Leptolyngbya sp. PCC 6406]